MPGTTRRAKIKAFAKVNLCLEVLGCRPDGYHDLRTVFQTISLADDLEVGFTPGRQTSVELESSVDIENNLVVRAARAVLEESGAKGLAKFRLKKKIPMGGGLGGGSTDAAAVLIALPVLTGRPIAWERLIDIGSTLGSDVPFFLMGGSAIGLGRGTELYPVADAQAQHVLLVAPRVHVSTAEAYKALGRPLTSVDSLPKINISQLVALAVGGGRIAGDWRDFCSNDFESVVFRQYPEIGEIRRKLEKFGARLARMTGSGAAVFGVFEDVWSMDRASSALRNETVIPISFVSRARYFSAWRKGLSQHIDDNQWPLHSRYSR